MDRYRIKPGGSFRMPDGKLKTAGEEIDLASDVAATHAGILDKLPPADPATADQPSAEAPANAAPQE